MMRPEPTDPGNGDPTSSVDPAARPGAFERMATRATVWAGSTPTFILAVVLVGLWLVLGPIFSYSDTWQLVANTVTSITTFLMVFLIQRAQNREMLANKIQMAELLASVREAHNTVIDLDDLSEGQLAELRRRYVELSHPRTPPDGPHQAHAS